MALNLICNEVSHRRFRILVTAEIAGVEITSDTAVEFGKTNKTAEFAAMNPFNKVPVLETPEGPIFESNAIVRYVMRAGTSELYGQNSYEQALVDQWLDFDQTHLELPISAWLYPIWGIAPFDAHVEKKAKKDTRGLLVKLDNILASKTWLVGERMTAADIVVASRLRLLYTTVMEPNYRKMFVNLNRWFQTVVNQAAFLKIAGETKLAEKMAVAKKPAKKEANKGKKKQKQQQQAAKPKKAKKAKNPLELLPKASFDLEEWKRTYQNSKNIAADAVPWFWENFNEDCGYSLWHCTYKEDVGHWALAFQAANSIGGWFQRMEGQKFGRFSFASVLVFNAAKPFAVSGVWLVRGSELPAELAAGDDAELYTWKQLTAADATLVNAYWQWEGDFSAAGITDAECQDGKNFGC